MIVKADGTLSCCDDSAPATDNTAKTGCHLAEACPGLAAAPIKPPAANQTAVTDAYASAIHNASEGDAPSAESAPICVVKTAPLAAQKRTLHPLQHLPPRRSQRIQSAGRRSSYARDHLSLRSTPAQDAANNARPLRTSRRFRRRVLLSRPRSIRIRRRLETQVASVNPAAQAAKSAPAASAGAGGYVMQIASLPSEADAKEYQANLSAKFTSVIGGHPIEVKRIRYRRQGHILSRPRRRRHQGPGSRPLRALSTGRRYLLISK